MYISTFLFNNKESSCLWWNPDWIFVPIKSNPNYHNNGINTDQSNPNYHNNGINTDQSNPNYSNSGINADQSNPNYSNSGINADQSNPNYSNSGINADQSEPKFYNSGIHTDQINPNYHNNGINTEQSIEGYLDSRPKFREKIIKHHDTYIRYSPVREDEIHMLVDPHECDGLIQLFLAAQLVRHLHRM